MPQHMLLLNFMSSPAFIPRGKPLSIPSLFPFTCVVVYSLCTSYFLSSFLNCGSGLATWLRSSSQVVPLLRAWPMQFSEGGKQKKNNNPEKA